jgi:hypothetical protein
LVVVQVAVQVDRAVQMVVVVEVLALNHFRVQELLIKVTLVETE